MLRIAPLSLAVFVALAGALPAQVLVVPYAPGPESVRFTGPWKRYQEHVLQLGPDLYAVLFRPGFIDRAGSVRAIAPLCAARGRKATGVGTVAPAELLFEGGVPRVLQGYRVRCE